MSSLVMDAEVFLHAEFDGQAVGVPAGLAHHVFAFQRLVAAHHVLDGAGHHMVDTRGAVGTRRTFKEHESVVFIAVVKAFLEGVVGFPKRANLVGCFGEIQLFIFLVVTFHNRCILI